MSARAVAAGLAALVLLVPAGAGAQWLPTGALAAVPVVHDCHETGGDVAATRLDPPTIYRCPLVVRLIRRKDPGAEHFYLVHEYGHIAMSTADEAAADCWAARALAKAPRGQRYLEIAIAHLRSRPHEESRRYGSPRERALRLQSCAAD